MLLDNWPIQALKFRLDVVVFRSFELNARDPAF